MIQKKLFSHVISLSILLLLAINLLFFPINIRAFDINNLTLEQKIAQMFMPSFGNLNRQKSGQLRPEIAETISRYGFGGIVLFESVYREKRSTLKLIRDIQNTAINSGVLPLLIATDYKSDNVVMFLPKDNRSANNTFVGKIDELENIEEYGKKLSKNLLRTGINCHFMPVMHVKTSPEIPNEIRKPAEEMSKALIRGCYAPKIIFESDSQLSITSDSGAISQISPEFSTNLIVVAKNFPIQTSELKVIKNLNDLSKNELAFFKTLIDSGVDAIMTTHIELPLIENKTLTSKKNGKVYGLPVSLSPTFHSILRNNLGFTGVIITNAMNAKPICEHLNREEAIKLAIQAGADMILCPLDLNNAEDFSEIGKIIDYIVKLVNSGEIKISCIDESVQRIIDLKERKGILCKDQYQISDIVEKISA